MKRTVSLVLATLALGTFLGCSSSSTTPGFAADAGVLRPDVGTSGQADVGTGGGGGGTSGTDTCGAIVTCANACQDQSCVDGCAANGSAAGKSQFDALFGCANTKCASATTDAAFQQCIQAQCSGEIAGCEGLGGGGGGGTGGGTGTGGCAALVQCLNACQQSDQACIQACAGQASPTAVTNYQALVQCAQTNNCTNPQTQQACLQQNCSAQVNTCLSN